VEMRKKSRLNPQINRFMEIQPTMEMALCISCGVDDEWEDEEFLQPCIHNICMECIRKGITYESVMSTNKEEIKKEREIRKIKTEQQNNNELIAEIDISKVKTEERKAKTIVKMEKIRKKNGWEAIKKCKRCKKYFEYTLNRSIYCIPCKLIKRDEANKRYINKRNKKIKERIKIKKKNGWENIRKCRKCKQYFDYKSDKSVYCIPCKNK